MVPTQKWMNLNSLESAAYQDYSHTSYEVTFKLRQRYLTSQTTIMSKSQIDQTY